MLISDVKSTIIIIVEHIINHTHTKYLTDGRDPFTLVFYTLQSPLNITSNHDNASTNKTAAQVHTPEAIAPNKAHNTVGGASGKYYFACAL